MMRNLMNIKERTFSNEKRRLFNFAAFFTSSLRLRQIIKLLWNNWTGPGLENIIFAGLFFETFRRVSNNTRHVAARLNKKSLLLDLTTRRNYRASVSPENATGTRDRILRCRSVVQRNENSRRPRKEREPPQ